MILVTGGTGLVGCHLMYLLLFKNKNIVALRRKTSNLDKVKKVFSTYSKKSLDLFKKINLNLDGHLDMKIVSNKRY